MYSVLTDRAHKARIPVRYQQSKGPPRAPVAHEALVEQIIRGVDAVVALVPSVEVHLGGHVEPRGKLIYVYLELVHVADGLLGGAGRTAGHVALGPAAEREESSGRQRWT